MSQADDDAGRSRLLPHETGASHTDAIHHTAHYSGWKSIRFFLYAVIMVFSFIMIVVLAERENHGYGLSTRTITTHIHKGSQPVGSYQVGLVVGTADVDFSTVRLMTQTVSKGDGVKDYYRAANMCDVSVCPDTTESFSKCLCDKYAVGKVGETSELKICKKNMEGIDDVTLKSPSRFASHDEQLKCMSSMLNDVSITPNTSWGFLHTQAPHVLGMVLGVIFVLWSVESMCELYRDETDKDNFVGKSGMDYIHTHILKIAHAQKYEAMAFLTMLSIWMVLFLALERGSWPDNIKMPGDAETWKNKHAFFDNTQLEVKDQKTPRHYARAVPWGSWTYGFLVVVLWGVNLALSYTFEYFRKTPHGQHGQHGTQGHAEHTFGPQAYEPDAREAHIIKQAKHEEQMKRDRAERERPLHERDGLGAPMHSTAERWNLSAFGMPMTTPVNYSLLVREDPSHTNHRQYSKNWAWSTTSVHEQTQLFKMAVLLTGVMLNLTMNNRYVSDVTYWSVVFLVVAYGVMDAAVRRVSELVVAFEAVYTSPKSTLTFVLGYLIKLLLAALGLAFMYYETYQSPLVNEYWVKKASGNSFLMEDDRGGEESDSENYVLMWTILFWIVLVLVDIFRDWGVFVSDAPADQVTLLVSSASNQTSKKYKMLVEVIVFLYAVCGLYILLYTPMLSRWKDHPELKTSFTMYEWHRNNWLYGVGEQSTLIFRA